MRVLVIGGGISDEREVSLRSSAAVFDAARGKHNAEMYDWDGSRDWLEKNISRFDAVLPILHGIGGEDGLIQSILEDLNAVYLGSDSEASKLCFNKQDTLSLLEENGITIPKGKLVNREEYVNDALFTRPHVLKPFNGGSSIDTFIYPKAPTINPLATVATFQRHTTMLLEEYIYGIEIAVPILENRTLDIIEIVPPENGVFDYDNKYNGYSKELVPPQNVPVKMQKIAHELGEKVHQITGCRHLSRTDMILSKGRLYVMEINTMPGLTDQSLFPKAALVAGLDFSDLVDYFIILISK